MRILPLLAITATLFTAPSLPAQAAPHEYHVCPADARGTVTHTGDASWVATAQSSRVLDTRIAPIGGVVALVCVYQMFGSEYWIYKRPSPSFTTCRPYVNAREKGFDCTP